MKARRPTPIQIAQRQREIDEWDVEHRLRETALQSYKDQAGFRDWLAPKIGMAYTFTVFLCFAVLAFGWWRLALFTAAVAAWLFVAERRIKKPLPYPVGWEPPRPSPIAIEPFNRFDNDDYLAVQDPEDFSAACECPGCGAVEVHSIMLETRNVLPSWARVARGCHICNRVWAQA